MPFLPHGTSLCEYTRFPQHNSSSDPATESAPNNPPPAGSRGPSVSPYFSFSSTSSEQRSQNRPPERAAAAWSRSPTPGCAGYGAEWLPSHSTPGLDGLGAPTPGHRDCLPAHVGSGQPPPAPPPAPRSSPPRPRRLRAAAQSRSRRRPARAAAASGESAGVPAPQPSAPPPFASAASSAPAPAARRCSRSSRCSTLLPLLRAAPRPPPPRARG